MVRRIWWQWTRVSVPYGDWTRNLSLRRRTGLSTELLSKTQKWSPNNCTVVWWSVLSIWVLSRKVYTGICMWASEWPSFPFILPCSQSDFPSSTQTEGTLGLQDKTARLVQGGQDCQEPVYQPRCVQQRKENASIPWGGLAWGREQCSPHGRVITKMNSLV